MRRVAMERMRERSRLQSVTIHLVEKDVGKVKNMIIRETNRLLLGRKGSLTGLHRYELDSLVTLGNRL